MKEGVGWTEKMSERVKDSKRGREREEEGGKK